MDLSLLGDAYDRAGFCVHADRVLPAHVVTAARRGLDEVRAGRYDTGRPPRPSPWNPGDSDDVLCKIEMPQMADAAIGALVGHSDLGALVSRVTRARRVQVWWVQLLHKPNTARDATGVNVGWHQDRQYWGAWEGGSELFTAWVALSKVDETAGPMRFVRGSHRWGVCGEGDFFGQDLHAQRGDIQVPEGERWEEVNAVMEPGGLSIHHCLTYHGSSANTSGSPRLSLAIHMCTENSSPVGGRREGLTAYLDHPQICPVIHDSA